MAIGVTALLVLGVLVGRQPVPLLARGVEARFVVLPILVLAALGFCAGRPARVRPWSVVAVLSVALFALHIASLLWAADVARTLHVAANSLSIIALVAVGVSLVVRYPVAVQNTLLLTFYWAGLAFALVSLASGSRSGIGRAVAFGGGPNVFARIVLLGVIAGVARYLCSGRRWWLAPIPLMLFAALLAGSRGASIAFVAVLAVALIFGHRRARSRLLVVVLVIGALATMAVALSQSTQDVVERRFDFDALRSSGYSSRPELWSDGLSIFYSHVWTGAGADSFAAEYLGVGGFPYPHNVLIEISADLGLAGLVLAAAVLIGAALAWFRNRWLLPVATNALFLSALFIFVASLFSGDLYDSRLGWVLLSVACAAIPIASEPDREKMPRTHAGLASSSIHPGDVDANWVASEPRDLRRPDWAASKR